MLDLIPKELQKDFESMPQSDKEKIVFALIEYPDILPEIVYIWSEKKLALKTNDHERYQRLIDKEAELLESLNSK